VRDFSSLAFPRGVFPHNRPKLGSLRPLIVGLNYNTAQIKVRNTNLNIRVLAYRYDLQLDPGIIIALLKRV
jgi:hypothetical protein